jgi:capsular polysaccharide biosynthesis protein
LTESAHTTEAAAHTGQPAHTGEATPAPRRRPRPTGLRPAWWPLPLCVLLGTLAGAAHGLLGEPRYTATSYVAVVPRDGTEFSAALGLTQAYGRIATGSAVLAAARAEAGPRVAPLLAGVRASTSPDAPLVEVTGTGAEPGGAARAANAVARALTRAANGSGEATGVRLTVFSAARPPAAPSSPGPVLTTAVGGCTGVLVGTLWLLVRPRAARAETGGAPRPVVPAPADAGARTADGASADGVPTEDGASAGRPLPADDPAPAGAGR